MNDTLKYILFFVTAMLFSYIHECAHMIVALWMGGCNPVMNKRGPFGNVMYLDSQLSSKRKMIVYLAGPGINLVIAAIAIMVYKLVDILWAGFVSFNKLEEVHWIVKDFFLPVYSQWIGEAAGWVGLMIEMVILTNIMLAAFNLLPFFPLDGGRAAVLILSAVTGSYKAMKIGMVFSYIFVVCVFISGIYLVQCNDMNIILSADAIYFLYILEREIYESYPKNRKSSYEG